MMKVDYDNLDMEYLLTRGSVEYTSPTGRKTTLYPIGTLAYVLGRGVQTIRKWEIGGIIPKTPFTVKGRRMYSKEHIACILQAAETSHICMGSNISETGFSNKVYREFQKLNQLFFVEDSKKNEIEKE